MVRRDLCSQDRFLDNPDLAQFLNHPQIIKEEKKKVVEAISPESFRMVCWGSL